LSASEAVNWTRRHEPDERRAARRPLVAGPARARAPSAAISRRARRLQPAASARAAQQRAALCCPPLHVTATQPSAITL